MLGNDLLHSKEHVQISPRSTASHRCRDSLPPHLYLLHVSPSQRSHIHPPPTLLAMSNRKGSWKGKKARQQTATVKEPDTSVPIGDTNLTHKDVSIYLVKMPHFLAECFESKDPSKQNEVVARLRIPRFDSSPGASKNSTARIFLDKVPTGNHGKSREAGVNGVDTEISTEFALDILKDGEDPRMMVFSCNRTDDDVDMRMEGKVSFQCTARPKMDRAYRSLNKRRTLSSMQRTREMLRMDDSARKAVDREAIQPLSMTETAKQREERKQKKEDARRHLDVPDEKWREIARVAVFKAFEIQSHYSAEEIARVVEEPVSRLRSVITEVCAYNKSGPFAGRYELKDEFKTVSQRRQKERDLENYRLEQIEIAKKRREERADRERGEGPPSKKARQN